MSDEISDLESRGMISDFFRPPPSVEISSDIQREIICAQQGRTARSFYETKTIDERTMKYKLTTTVSIIDYFNVCFLSVTMLNLTKVTSYTHHLDRQKYVRKIGAYRGNDF